MNQIQVVNNRNSKKVVASTMPKVVNQEAIKDQEAEILEGVKRHAFVPDKSYAKNYIHRKVNGISDFSLMDYAMKTHSNVILRGDTGAGKTMMPMAYAADRNIPYYSLPCDISIDPTALLGKMMPTDTIGKFRWADGPVTELVRYGGVLNISEMNFMSPKVAAAIYGILDHRRSLALLGHDGEVIDVADNLLVVGDYNPKYRGTQELNLAFLNRFPIKVEWGYDAAVENNLIKSSALLMLVRNVRSLPDVRTPVGTNSMQIFEQLAPTLGLDFAVKNFVAQFSPSEQEPISQAFKLAEGNLKKDLAAIKAGRKPDDDIGEIEADPAWLAVEGDPDDYELEEIQG